MLQLYVQHEWCSCYICSMNDVWASKRFVKWFWWCPCCFILCIGCWLPRNPEPSQSELHKEEFHAVAYVCVEDEVGQRCARGYTLPCCAVHDRSCSRCLLLIICHGFVRSVQTIRLSSCSLCSGIMCDVSEKTTAWYVLGWLIGALVYSTLILYRLRTGVLE